MTKKPRISGRGVKQIQVNHGKCSFCSHSVLGRQSFVGSGLIAQEVFCSMDCVEKWGIFFDISKELTIKRYAMGDITKSKQ